MRPQSAERLAEDIKNQAHGESLRLYGPDDEFMAKRTPQRWIQGCVRVGGTPRPLRREAPFGIVELGHYARGTHERVRLG